MVQKSVVAGKRRMVYDALQSHDSAEALALEEKREDSGDWLVGDGSVDSHGHVADKRRTGGWRAAPLIFGTELCERLATLGLQRNLVLYFTTEMHFSNPESAKMVSNFVGAVYLTPFLGGFAADAYLGRFWAITIFATIQVLGMICLALSATVPWLRPPPCSPSSLRSSCEPSHGVQVAVLYLGLFLFAVGNGGIKPNVSTLGADQFDEGDPNERKHMSHFFNWFYFIISIGSLLSVTLFVYIQDNVGFGWGFGLPAAVMMVAVVVFLAGARIYRFKAPGGSALTTIAQVAVAAARNRKVCVTTGEKFLYEGPTHGSRPVEKLSHTDQLLFLDRAAIPAKDSNLLATSAWHLCSVTQVEEVKMILKVLPIWVSTLLVWTALSQMETFTVEVGATMDRHVTAKFLFPSASLAVFELVNIIFILPLYDRFLVPLLRRFTGHPQGITTLQRIGTGMIFATLAMVVAAAVETRRVQVARENGLLDRPDLTIPMSVFWLVPQNFLRGSTEIFTQIGQLEFFYNEAPERMRSLGSAIYLSTIACGFFLSSALVTAVNKFTSSPGWLTDNLNRSRLDLFYLLLAGFSLCNFFLFLVCSSWYKYKQVNNSRSYTRIIGDHDES